MTVNGVSCVKYTMYYLPKKKMMLTPLILPEFNGLVHRQLIRVRLRIKAVERLQHNSEVSRASVNRTPRSDGFEFVNLRFYIFEVFLSKALDGLALRNVSSSNREAWETLVRPTLIKSHNKTSPAVSNVKTRRLSFSSRCFTRPN